jgi:hypothetical protein
LDRIRQSVRLWLHSSVARADSRLRRNGLVPCADGVRRQPVRRGAAATWQREPPGRSPRPDGTRFAAGDLPSRRGTQCTHHRRVITERPDSGRGGFRRSIGEECRLARTPPRPATRLGRRRAS